MASGRETDKGRFGAGPRPLASLLPKLTRPALRSRHAASAQLMADWPDVVGPALAACTWPHRLSSGALTLACAGPMALELQHLAGQLIERINAFYGRVAVERLRFVQASAALPASAAPPRRARPAPLDLPTLPPGPLRDALAALGAAVAERERHRYPADGASRVPKGPP